MEVCVGRCHGGWEPKDGWVQVPRGTTVYMFLDAMSSMADVDADHAVLSTAEGLQALQSKASQTITEFKTVNNYGIQSLSASDPVMQGPLAAGVELVNEDGLHLSDVMAKYKGNNIYWFACQAIMLNPNVDGVNLDDLDLDEVASELAEYGDLEVDSLDHLSDDQKTRLEGLMNKMGLSDLKALQDRKKLVNQIQRF